MEQAVQKLGEILREIASKVHIGDFEDVEELEYWQGKKDGIRLALIVMQGDTEDADMLARKLNSRFVKSEERVLGIDSKDK